MTGVSLQVYENVTERTAPLFNMTHNVLGT
jgi:hypothetical protein